jgi:hypothetical protein
MQRPTRAIRTVAGVTGCASLLFHAFAAAAEPTAQAVEFYKRAAEPLLHHRFPRRGRDAGRGHRRAGLGANGRHVQRMEVGRRQPDRHARVPVLRHAGASGPTRISIRPIANECALVKQNPDWTFEAIAFYIEPPHAAPCAAGTAPIYRSFYPGPNVSASNHRFVPDLTLHQKMAAVVHPRRRRDVRAAVVAQIQADAVRLLEQSTFGPTDALVGARQSRRCAAFPGRAVRGRGSRYSSTKYVPFGRRHVSARPTPIRQCRRDYYTLFQLQNDFFRNALTATTSCASASRSRCRRSS